jgi:serine/threonine protein kinase
MSSPLRGVASTKLLSSGGNGAVYKATFSDGATGILKIPKGVSKDNLMYEYLAGSKLNQLRHIFPQFIETKHIFYYEQSLGNPPDLHRLRNLSPHTPSEGCRTAGHQALLIKEVNGPSLKSKLRDEHFLVNDLAAVLFQIYYTLDALKHDFTHFDLHSENVLLDNPVGKPMLFRYIAFNPPIEFISNFMPKIIDYGRAFVKGIDLSGLSSPSCNTTECAPEGRHCGFTYYHHEFQDVTKPNVSQDLRLLVNLPGKWAEFSKHVRFGYNVPPHKVRFTTQEQKVGEWPKRIVNVTDALSALKHLVSLTKKPYGAIVEISGNGEYKFIRQNGGRRTRRR